MRRRSEKKALFEKDKAKAESQLASIVEELSKASLEAENVAERIAVDSKMLTAVKRDFRGILLAELINNIDANAKDYCSQIFGADDISCSLEGNNIEIIYDGRPLDNLSGGEKQKVDLILQFALREMMCEYLGFSSNILILDEILDNLDAIGSSKVLTFIQKNLASVESLFIISHHEDELNLDYDSILTIEKNEAGISSIA